MPAAKTKKAKQEEPYEDSMHEPGKRKRKVSET